MYSFIPWLMRVAETCNAIQFWTDTQQISDQFQYIKTCIQIHRPFPEIYIPSPGFNVRRTCSRIKLLPSMQPCFFFFFNVTTNMLYNNVPFWLHLAQRKNKTMTKTATQSSKSALTIKLCVHRHTQTHKLYVHVYMTITAPSNIFHCTQTKWIIKLRLTTEWVKATW